MEEKEPKSKCSRRSFLINGSTAVGVMGLVAGMSAGSLIKPPEAHAGVIEFPIPAVGLDVEAIRKYGYCEYFQSGCGHGAGTALVRGFIEACESMGYSETGWHQLPYGMFSWANGGAVGWGATCGAINGCLAVLNLARVDGVPLSTKVGNALVDWYTKQTFPLANLDGYIPPVYPKLVPVPIRDSDIPAHTVPESPLCHISVTKWLTDANATLASVDGQGRNLKADRCSKLTGDTAAQAAKLINNFLVGLNPPAWKPTEDYVGCYDCHSTMKDMQGKMNCVYCHTGDAAIVGSQHGGGMKGRK